MTRTTQHAELTHPEPTYPAREAGRCSRWIRDSIILGAVLAISVACKGPQIGGPDTDSHWLETCDENDDCAEGLECLCDRCTVACDDDEACGSLGGTASCATSAGTCTQTACVAECLTDDDCPSSAATCQEERCIDLRTVSSAGASPAGAGGTSATGGNAAGQAEAGEATTSAGAECAPAGLYEAISVVGNEDNSAQCPELQLGPLNITAEGWLESFPGCDALGCDNQNCTSTPVSTTSCNSTVRLWDDCASLGDGRSTTFETSYVGDQMTLIMTDSDSPGAGACSYEIVARLVTNECPPEDPCECTTDADCPSGIPTCFGGLCSANVMTGAIGPGETSEAAGTAGTGPGEPAATECSPMGTYDVSSITVGPDSSDSCTIPPLSTLEIFANGTGLPSCGDLTCASSSEDCELTPVSAESCTAKVFARDLCTAVGEGATNQVEYSYEGDTLNGTLTETNAVSQVRCSYTLVAQRRE